MSANIITPYPLTWPQGIPRTKRGFHARSPFRTGFPKAVANVVTSLSGFGKDAGKRVDHPVLSSNVDLMGRLLNNDSGVACWFIMEGSQYSFGVDRFRDAASNVQAIHHIIEARRTELRHGGWAFVHQTFKSFLALPAPPGSHWSDVLELTRDAPREAIEAAFKRLAAVHHPDKGGDQQTMAAINQARQVALAELGRQETT